MKRKNKNESLRQAVATRDGWSCCWCGIPLSPGTATLEHFLARSRGGTNTLSNLRLSCAPCNNGRNDGVPRLKTKVKVHKEQSKRRPQQDACYVCGAACESSILCPSCTKTR